MTITQISQDPPAERKTDPCVEASINRHSIVAIHGLDENGTTAWTHPETRYFWLQDLCSDDDLGARVLTFDYKADATSFFGSTSADRILHHAQTLLEELSAERELEDCIERPIVFICHGLGGVIVKKALAISSASTSAKQARLHSIVTSTFGLIFFGTPHEGIEKGRWFLLSRGLKGILKNKSQLVAAIEKNAETLQNITDQFLPLLKQFRIHNFWEMVETSRGMSKGYIVSPISAAPPWDAGRSGLHAPHSLMCKFKDSNEYGCRMVRGILLRYASKAGPIVSSRLKEAKQYLKARREYEAAEILTFDIHDENKPVQLTWNTTKDFQNQHYIVPFTASENYVGRKQLAHGLRERILAPHEQQKRFVLYGLGGSGKSQFCLKFAWDNRDSFWGVFWIDASSAETAEQAFSNLARIGQMEEKFETGKYWLSKQEMPWLLVIDNADDAEFDYARYFPTSGQGHILVTSRNPDCKVHATIGFEEFKSLDEEDAITLLLRAAFIPGLQNMETRESSRPIVKALGCLPLAIIQAGASIRQNICSLEDYLSVFESYKTRIFSNKLQQGRGSYAHTIFTTFEVSFNKIKSLTTSEATDAIEILYMMAFLHFDQVPEILFAKAWRYLHEDGKSTTSEPLLGMAIRLLGDLATVSSGYGGWLTPLAEGQLPRMFRGTGKNWDKIRFRNAIHILRSYSLIFANRAVDSYSMHPMVHFWARERLNPTAQKVWGNLTGRILAAAITSASEESEVIYRRQLMPHVDSCLKIEPFSSRQGVKFNNTSVSQFAKFAAVYAEGGRWNDASCIQEQILQHRDSSQDFDIMANLARSYWNSSQIPKAMKLQSTLLDVLNKKLGPHDPRTLQAMDNLGRTCWLCGRISEADKLGKQAFDGLSKIVGLDHPYTLSAMHNFARARLHLGYFEEAQTLQLRCLEWRLRLYDDTNLDTLETMQDLGMSCLSLKQIDEAERLVSHVLDARKRILGPEHAHTLWSNNDLSKVYCAQGYPKDAIALLIPTREIATRTLGASHIGTFMTIFNLARALRISGQLEEAESSLSALIKWQMKALGSTHQDVYWSKMELAQVCKQTGDLEQAESLAEEVFDARRKSLGEDNVRTLEAKKLVCEIYRASDKIDEAVVLGKGLIEDKV
ncbi:hypothetical protein AJ80_08835 [Polytolypa hystricis UAMH7299]|uniref:NB-ARC domain-containing protein n=1 Tax=Polytolypa hystricis (strain UAMH7299) TaxID=1447883 RepID=A0A2B7WT16_POLH7|nr:hypothetical protein AJ80_08835 [Polytolypa hystricis UAMH7299]